MTERNSHMQKLWVLSALIVTLGLQLMAALAFFCPGHPMLYYGVFLGFTAAGQAGALLASGMTKGSRCLRLLPYLTVEALLTFFMWSAIVKLIFYGYRPQMATHALHVLFVLAVLNKIFWRRIETAGAQGYALLADRANAKFLRYAACAAGTFLAIFIVFIPDYVRALARMYIGEQFHHIGIFVMAAGWAAYKGHVMDVDQISQYGVGMPYLFAWLCRGMGSFSHEHVFLIIMTGTIIYYVLFFWACRRWFKSASLSLIVLLLGVRMQMFHPGGYPMTLTYPSATMVRYFFDVFVAAMLARHLHRGGGWLLVAAGLVSGYSIYYIDSTGLFLAAAFYAYLFSLWFFPSARRLLPGSAGAWGVFALAAAAPLVVAAGLFYKTAGNHLFTKVFWLNFIETVEYFLSGIGTYPMYENFKYHNFWAGLMGFIIPMLYVWTIIFVGSLVYLKRFSRRHIFVIIICIYGLGVDHYYIARSVLTSYYVTALPFAVLCGYWLKLFIWGRAYEVRLKMLLALFAFSVYALTTNHNFMAYPNIFNFSRNPMVDPAVAQPLPADLTTYFNHLYRNDPPGLKLPANSLGLTDEELYVESSFPADADLVGYYKYEFDFSKDAAMIREFTKPDERVALISDFEVRMLIQADRRPFFYYFPLINNRPKHMRTMPICFLHTATEKFNATAINQLEQAKPEYVFLEKIFLYPFPKAYADKGDNIIPIVQYVRSHYSPYKTGEYIAVMKRQ